MQKYASQKTDGWLARIRRHRTWKKVVGVLACLVVFCTTYALILPAITLENEAQCGKTEHTHTLNCYTQAEVPQILVCTTEEASGHQHTAACLGSDGQPECGYADFVIHRHSTDCYDEDGSLLCTLPVITAHTHTAACYPPAHSHTQDCYTRTKGELTCTETESAGHIHCEEAGCYDENGELTCTEAESSGHTHTDDCYAWEESLTCTLTEITEAEAAAADPVCGKEEIIPHTHTAACFDADGTWICGQLQVLSHTHADSCFETANVSGEPTLSCGMEEHTHTQACYPIEPTPTVSPEASQNPDTLGQLGLVAAANGAITDPDAEDPPPVLAVDETVTTPINNEEITLVPFVPEYTHYYRFNTTTDQYAYAYLYDENMTELTHNSSSSKSISFYDQHLIAGKTYFIGVKTSSSSSGTASITPSLGSCYYQPLEDGTFGCPCGKLESHPGAGTCGYYGDNLTWKVDTNGVLTISGEGDMASYSSSNPPWSQFKAGLTAVVVEEGVTSIGYRALAYLPEGVTISLPDGLTTINREAFYGSKFKDLNIPDSVTSLGEQMCESCSKLETLHLPASCTSIPKRAFWQCGNLQSVDIPNGVTSIGESAFLQCSSMTSVTIPETVTSIGNSAFSSCTGLTSVTIPETVTSIAYSTFYGCSKLTDINIPKNVTSIGSSAFYNCRGLTSIDLPEGLRTIGSGAFDGCSGLETLTIPSTVTSIGYDALRTNGLNTLYWNARNATISSGNSGKTNFQLVIGPNARFTTSQLAPLVKMGCTSVELPKEHYLTLSALEVDFLDIPMTTLSESLYYVDEQGVLYRVDEDTGKAYLAYCPDGLENYTVLSETPAVDDHPGCAVVGVDSYAFYSASTLTALNFTLPTQITELKNFAFYNAKNLASINGKSQETDILAMFAPDVKTGSNVFENTMITYESKANIGDFKITGHGLNVTISTTPGTRPPTADNPTFRYYTGESVTTNITVSNPTDTDVGEFEDGTVLRIYYRMDTQEGQLRYKPGTYSIKTDQGHEITMTVSKTSVPNCYCLELGHPQEGDTISLSLTGTYPSPSSSGGTATVWGAILTADEAAQLGDDLAPVVNSHVVSWETKRDVFPVTKTLVSSTPPTLAGDGQGGATVNGFSYRIKMQREGDTLEGVGKDHMTSADFVDVLTLPEGMKLSDKVIEAVNNGTYTVRHESYDFYYRHIFYLPDGKTPFLMIRKEGAGYDNGGKSVTNRYLTINENGQLEIHWTFLNSDYMHKEIDNVEFSLELRSNLLEIPHVEDSKTYEIQNDVNVTQHFMHTPDDLQTDGCPVELTPEEGTLELIKDCNNGYHYMGTKTAYKITLKNPKTGISPEVTTLRDVMQKEMYLSAEQMAAVFQDDTHPLTIQISPATLCMPLPNDRTVTGIDSTTTGQLTQQDTGVGTRYNGMSDVDPAEVQTNATITLTGDRNGLTITRDDGTTVTCAATGEAIRQVLDSWGYLVTHDVQYTLNWDLRKDGNPITLVGGAAITKNLDVTLKDTFMWLDADKEHAIDMQSSHYAYNYAYADRADGKILSSKDWVLLNRDFQLDKGWSLSGNQEIKPSTKLEQGMVLDYQLTFEHRGDTYYDALPLTDHMSGAQALLAPVNLNQNEAWAENCPTVTLQDGTVCYILKNPGTYTHVWTGPDRMADTVAITKTDAGLDTVIKWYFTDYSGNRSDTVSYHAMICPQDVLPEGVKAYSLGNETWLGDHESHRLYANIPGWLGTTLSFDKKIVEKVGDDGGWVHSSVKEDGSVVYRLTVYSATDIEGKAQETTLTGNDLYDALPKSIADWRWTKDLVKIDYGKGYDVVNGENWSITEATKDHQQEIRWADDFKMTFTGRADIYVTLKFPEGDPWVKYVDAYGVTGLVNTFYVLGGQASVTHDLSIQGQVRLQKGVYSSGYQGKMGGHADARWYYSNSDDGKYMVEYYVTLYNGGRSNLYLTDMQDRLPRGFTYNVTNTTYNTNSKEYRVPRVYYQNGTRSAAHMRVNYQITELKREDGTQYLNFHFIYPTTESDPTWDLPRISYDEEREMCYLRPGQAIVLTYSCSTNQEPDTDDLATNIVTMPYYNFNGGGVTVDENSITKWNGKDEYTPNDGGCDVRNAGEAHSYGFVGGESDTEWLTSQVTVQRGAVKPGITKKLISTTDINGKVTMNPVAVGGTDTLQWRIIADNDGTMALTDYVLTDSMQAPYHFTGAVHYTLFSSYWKTDDQSSTLTPVFDRDLFTITKWDEEAQTVTIQLMDGYKREVTIDGDPVLCTVKETSSYYSNEHQFYVAFAKEEETGNAVMFIRFVEPFWTLASGSSAVMTLNTKSTENELVNRQFSNATIITPMQQSWDNKTNKGNIRMYMTPWGLMAMPSVRNSAPVTTAFGYTTTSIKRIEEKNNPSNCAASTDEEGHNYIALSDRNNEFIYTLTVNNNNPQAMDKLILIDRLPEKNDHTVFDKNNPRGSEFKVSFAEVPNFQVIVTQEDGTTKTLTEDTDYTLEFSGKTEFVDADWQGHVDGDNGDWNEAFTDLATQRTLRLTINDPDGKLIPQQSSLSLKFTCKVDDENAQPGEIAWNAFGYRYSMYNVGNDLDAAPLKVGVKIPTIPQLVKKLVDHKGAAMTATADQTYSFLVYEGDALTDEWETLDDLTAALGTTGRKYKTFTVTVPNGKSESDATQMTETDAEDWTWVKGNQYTIVELPTGEDSEFGFHSFGVITKNAHTFTYDPVQDQIITCSNVRQIWDVDLTKAEPDAENSANDKPLEGVIFALYSPDIRDAKNVPTEYADLDIAPTIEQDGATWYLHSIQTTDANGKIQWKNLNRERYYLLEVKTLDGYLLPKNNPRLLNRHEESQGALTLTIYNYTGVHELPKSGGAGVWPYTAGGIALLAAGAILLLRKKRGEGKPSSP